MRDDRSGVSREDPATAEFGEKLDLTRKILEGESGQADILGFFGGKIVIELYRFPEDISQKAEEINISVDPKSLDIEYIDGDVKQISGGAMQVENGGRCEIICESGEVFSFEGEGYRLVGEVLIAPGGEAVNYRTGEKYKVKNANCHIAAETEDGYIVSEFVTDENGLVTDTKYKKIPESELFERA